jgi:eukaryotic-like serine/threonine-protein kinase
LIGKKVAHYTITGKLGEGGMGVVYEANDGHLDRAVAIKVLPHDAVADLGRKQRFVQEARAASALNHPYIVTIYDIDCDEGVDYIAMELIRGRTLEQMLSRGKLRLAEALKYGSQIADALAAAHSAGIVHRDLKPGNIMITERGDVKVLDFGLAKLTDAGDVTESDQTRTQGAVTQEGSVVGSAPYMSPEQAEGRKVDARSDIFSFGSVLYEMLTGRQAFQRGTRMATMAAILNQEPEAPSKVAPELPREVERVVVRCLRKDLDRRSQSMAEIRIALEDLKEETESGSLVAPAAPAVRRTRRWPLYAGAGLAVIAAAVAFRMLAPAGETPALALHARVLTSFVGYQGEPSLSPDGNQFAFSWDRDVPDGPPHVYISLISNVAPLRLTPESDTSWGPAWSPDGQSIAYVSSRPGAEPEILVMPALGGTGRKIASGGLIAWRSRSSSTAIGPSWSPDAKWMLWSKLTTPGSSANFVQAAPAGGGEAHELVDPATSGAMLRGHRPVISPDGREMVWERCDGNDCDLYLVGVQDGRATGVIRKLTHDHATKRSAVWTVDGKEVVYLAGDISSEVSMYRVSASGGEPRRINGIGANGTWMSLAAKGGRLAYSTVTINYDIHRLDLKSADAKPERFLSSTRYDAYPVYSPDGKRIAFSSNRGGVRQIWVADADGGNVAALTSFPSGVAERPQWSADGQSIVFDAGPNGNWDVYTVASGGGPVKRLTDQRGTYQSPSWSPDGKWIYFRSTRGGQSEIYRIRPDGSGSQQMTKNHGAYGWVTPDGKWLYYEVARRGLWKMPAEGGEATEVKLSTPGTFAGVAERGFYVMCAPAPEGVPVLLYPFDGGKPRTLATLYRLRGEPALSPDGRWLVYATADNPVYEISLVEGFR